ncbi:hypothetical protein BDW60DRAFT_219792 [Aspergillus nidulans var. acristatus]
MAASSRTWLITGASSGLGKSLALAALKAGHKVIGTTRDVGRAEKSCPDFSTEGGIWIELDPAQKTAYYLFAKCAQEHDVDVLVNNAGYAFIGGVEDTSLSAGTHMSCAVRPTSEIRWRSTSMALCELSEPVCRFCGPKALATSSLLAVAQGRGTYSASKFAIEAMHESLSYEVKDLGIKVLIVEPGAFRTPFASRVLTPTQFEHGFSEGYRDTVLQQMVTAHRSIKSIPDHFKGDPDKAARAILSAIASGHEYLRLPLGMDCVAALEDKIGQLQRDLAATRAIATATDVD